MKNKRIGKAGKVNEKMSKTTTLSVTATAAAAERKSSSKSSGGGGNAASGEFDVPAFEQKLKELKDTQDSIQQLSAWCLQRRAHHKKIVTSWLNILKQGKTFRLLCLARTLDPMVISSAVGR